MDTKERQVIYAGDFNFHKVFEACRRHNFGTRIALKTDLATSEFYLDPCTDPMGQIELALKKLKDAHEEAIRNIPSKQQSDYVRLGHVGDLQKIHLKNHTYFDLRPKDMALGLAKRCRFGGSVPGWYSVAEHAILGSYMTHDKKLQREFLVHDNAEYVFEDVMSPVAALIPEYKQKRDEFQYFINNTLLGYSILDPRTKQLDNRLYCLEQWQLRNNPEYDPIDTDEPGIIFPQWDWQTAEREYMKRFHQLFEGWNL